MHCGGGTGEGEGYAGCGKRMRERGGDLEYK